MKTSLSTQNKMNYLREFMHKKASLIVASLSVALTIVLCITGQINEVIKKADTLLSVGATLAGFLFAGQSVLLALSPKSDFLTKAKKEGYLYYVHKFCAISELAFITSIFLGINVFPWKCIDYLFICLFFFALGMSVWSIKIYAELIKFYVQEEQVH